MKLKIFSSALALAALGLASTGAYAQTPAPATPAPVPTELVYLQQLPTVASLMSTAKAEGVTVVKISQTSTEINVVYQNANGQMNNVSYQVLPAGEGVASAAAPAAAPVPGAGPTVVYQTTTAPAYYYDPYYYSPYYAYPWGWYPPVGISLGFGWRGGWRGGWRR